MRSSGAAGFNLPVAPVSPVRALRACSVVPHGLTFRSMTADQTTASTGTTGEPLTRVGGAQSSESRGAFVDGDGQIHVRELTIPPSQLWSAEYTALYLQSVAAVPEADSLAVPERTAPAAQWHAFDEWWDRRFNLEPLARARVQYPVDVEEVAIAGVRAAVITPREGVAAEHRDRVLLNLHGGGFVFHRGLSFGQLESIPLAAIGRYKVITLDYRQAPFHRYPAATSDVLAVYSHLLQQHAAESIGIYGCSAGGTLTTQVIASLQARGLPRPGAIGVFNIGVMPHCDRPPWGRGWGESSMWYAGVPKNEMSPADHAVWDPVRWYMDQADPHDTQAYPGASDDVLARFPPTLFLSGTRDFALSAVVFSHARLVKLGVDAALYVLEAFGHSGHVAAVGTPEAHDAHSYVAHWFGQKLR